MNAILSTLRWSDPQVAAAFFALRDECAPDLGNLVFSDRLPDDQLEILLDWAAALAEPDPCPAFEIKTLVKVFMAINAAWIATHNFRSGIPSATGPVASAEPLDAGIAETLGKTVDSVSRITIALHGELGARILMLAQADLQDAIEQLTEASSKTA